MKVCLEFDVFKKGKTHKIIIDEEDKDLIIGKSLFLESQDKHGNMRVLLTEKRERLHRLIMKAKPGEVVDHVNGNSLDNRKVNLRLCSHANNMRNRTRFSDRIGFKGVSKSKDAWASQITYNYKKIHLGRFKTKEEAARMYDLKAKELFGDFACTNEMLGLFL